MCTCSAEYDQDEQAKRNRQINQQIKKDLPSQQRTRKLLLLGAGAAGKTTMFKQMRVLHMNGFTEEERQSFLPIMRQNLLGCMENFIKATGADGAALLPEFGLDTPSINKRASLSILTTELVQNFNNFRSRFQNIHLDGDSGENSDEILNLSTQIVDSNYIPTPQNILNCRKVTTTIQELTCSIQGVPFHIVDVGGQRNERRKWIYLFEGVAAVIFVVALSEYDMFLEEDPSKLRMHESLSIFTDLCTTQWFEDSNIIVFLNKTDAFRTKIAKTNLNVCFPEYNGPQAYKEAAEFVKNKFEEIALKKGKLVTTQFTCGTDTQTMAKVFDSVRLLVQTQSLLNSGF